MMDARGRLAGVTLLVAGLFIAGGPCRLVLAEVEQLGFPFWGVPGESPGGSQWEVSPATPKTTDVVQFSGTTQTFGNGCEFELWCGCPIGPGDPFGGIPTAFVTVDSTARTIELWVQGHEGACTAQYDPVFGYAEGQFGPLAAGDWRFFCDDPMAVFSISIHVSSPLTLLNPNGGEQIVAGSVWSITWTDSRPGGTRAGQYHLDYSPDGGTTWTPITAAPLAGVCSYDWATPPGGSSQCLIRVRDAADGNIYDTSDAPFTLRSGPRIITVDNDGPADFNNIQAAIDDANDGDEVVVADGVYAGDNDWFSFRGKAITVRSVNGPENCILDGGYRTAGVIFGDCEDRDSVLMGFTVRRAVPGVYCGSSSPFITECVFRDNHWPYADGGAISLFGGSPLITNCVFVGNSSAYGGAIGWEYLASASADIVNCTFYANRAGNAGGAVALSRRGEVAMSNCIVWGNEPADSSLYQPDDYGPYKPRLTVTNCVLQSEWTKEGHDNVVADPCFALPGYWDPNGTPENDSDDFWVDGDYHLKSQAGRWDAGAGAWVYDDVTSVGIDFGDPLAPVGLESFPNGGRINAGAYGGTAEASRSWFGGPVCETIMAGDINGDCKVDFRDFWFVALNWLRDERPPEDGGVQFEAAPPTPNPMDFDVGDPNGGVPHDVWVGPSTSFGWAAEMTALAAVDDSGPVEYYFQCISQPGFDSGPVPACRYQVLVGRAGSQQGLQWRVRARDVWGNETGWSAVYPTRPPAEP